MEMKRGCDPIKKPLSGGLQHHPIYDEKPKRNSAKLSFVNLKIVSIDVM
jgi:hypothetical protein